LLPPKLLFSRWTPVGLYPPPPRGKLPPGLSPGALCVA
jgi:hypothetical protein